MTETTSVSSTRACGKLTDEQLLRRTAHSLLRGAWSHEMDDLMQEGRIALWRRADKIPKDPAHATAFKVQVAKGAMIDFMRSQAWGKRAGVRDTTSGKSMTYTDPDWLSHSAEEPDSAPMLLENRDACAALMYAINKSGPTAHAVVLHTLNGVTTEQVSKMLGVSRFSIRLVLSKVMRHLERAPQSKAGAPGARAPANFASTAPSIGPGTLPSYPWAT